MTEALQAIAGLRGKVRALATEMRTAEVEADSLAYYADMLDRILAHAPEEGLPKPDRIEGQNVNDAAWALMKEREALEDAMSAAHDMVRRVK